MHFLMEKLNKKSILSIMKVLSYKKIEIMFANLRMYSMDLNKIQEHGSQGLTII